jgi:uncharacterized membrane protein
MRDRRLIDVVLLAFGIVYPALVFFLRGTIDPWFFVIVALVAVALRIFLVEDNTGLWRPAFLVVAAGLAGLAFIDTTTAARAYPVLLSLAAAGVFAVTLVRPPSLIERLALATGAASSPELQAYCRNVTLLWVAWLTINALVAGGLALSGDDRDWALWTGVISYIVSGALLCGEWLVRRSLVGRASR